MQPYMVQYVAELGELLIASQALEHLISSTSSGIYDTSLDVSLLVFGDLLLLSCHSPLQNFLIALSRRFLFKLRWLHQLCSCRDYLILY